MVCFFLVVRGLFKIEDRESLEVSFIRMRKTGHGVNTC